MAQVAAKDSRSDFDPMISKDARCYSSLVIFTMIASIVNIAGTFFTYSFFTNVQLPEIFIPSLDPVAIFGWLPLYIFLYLMLFTLYAMLIEDLGSKKDQRPLRTKLVLFASLLIFFVALYLAIAGFTKPFLGAYTDVYPLFGSYGIYIVLAIVYRLFGRTGFCANMLDMVKPISWFWDRAQRVLTARNRP